MVNTVSVDFPPQPSSSGRQSHRGPQLVFIVTIILWDTLFMAVIYFALHVMYTKYTRGLRIPKRWFLLVGILVVSGIGPVFAFTVLTDNHLVFLLGLISMICLFFPVPAFSFALLTWKSIRRAEPRRVDPNQEADEI